MAEEKADVAFEVALDLPNAFNPYHYKIPEEMIGRAQLGMRVLVPVRSRRITGYLLKASEPPEGIELKAVIDLLDDVPRIRSENALNYSNLLLLIFFIHLEK